MNSKKLLFIVNPQAGKGLIKNRIMEIINRFTIAGYEVTVAPTLGPKDAILIAKERARDYDLLVCSGGDGTLDEVVTGMMKCDCKAPIGYIPSGSTNDFAKSLKIPFSVRKATELIIQNHQFACDIGSFNDDVFVYIAAFGIFTDVSYGTKQEVKNVLGHMAYLLEGMKRLPDVNQSCHMHIEYDDQVIDEEFVFGMITNSYSVGGFKSITGKHVELDDGVFEVTLIKKPANPLEMQGIMTALIARETDERYMYSFKAKELAIQTNNKIPWTLDGEFGGNQDHVLIRNHKQALRIITPQNKN
ncbi:MAG: YegS/Rv2252/BmrU family lipid kinase [Clostridia bacterium]|nr:YegS/Rv2252/BmrU family lipid kinase [Clostridia bacterium]